MIKRNGFTIVELLIVIVVIGILAAITIVAYNGISSKATVASLQSDLENDNKQMLAYLTTSSTGFPTSIDCSATPAANTICLKSSGTTTYQYSVNNASLNAPTYCITATSGTTSYYIGTSQSNPTAGACPGHGSGGVAAITNLVTNPSLELNSATYSAYIGTGAGTFAWVKDGGAYGSNYARITVTTGSTQANLGQSNGTIPANSNAAYTGALSVRTNVTQRFYVVLFFYDSALGGLGSAIGTSAQVDPGVWTRMSVNGTTPANAAFISIRVQTAPGTGYHNPAVGDIIETDGLMVTAGPTVYNYADPSINANWLWNGTPNAATSTGPAV